MLNKNVVCGFGLQGFRGKRVDVDHFTGLASIDSFHFCEDRCVIGLRGAFP